MRKSGILQKLTAQDATDKPFISIYLNAEPNEHGRDNFDAFLKKQISLNEENFEEGSPERESFDRDAQRIRKYAENINPAANGVAIFACAENDFFQKYEFNVPFEENRFEVMNKPHIYPLARMVDQNPEFAVVLADSNHAKIYTMQRGQILDTEEIESEKYSRTEAGGWSQMRFQRHIDEMRKQHAREVIDELESVVRESDIRQIVLAGNKDVVIPLLKDEMNDFLNERLAGTVRMQIDASEDEIFDSAESAIKTYDTLQDMKKIEVLNEEHYDTGKGVKGVTDTLKALANGQVQELYLVANFDEFEYDEESVKEVLEAYSPGEDTDVPSVKKSRAIADDIISRALDSAERIRFIEDENLLKESGGIGALLRFSMSANQT